MTIFLSVAGVFAPFGGALAYDPHITTVPNETPKELSGIGISEKLGESIDLSTPFKSDTGEDVTLGHYFQTGRPVLLTVVYYGCPGLCNYHLNGLTEALRQMPWTVGQEFELVAISMDGREGPDLAAQKKQTYVDSYGRGQSINGWHFLTGSKESIQKLTEQIGFRFRWDEESKQFAHASAATIMTPGGTVSRYLHGVAFDPQTLKLALLEAGGGKIGSIVDKIVMFCFQFDPRKSKYTIYAWNIMRVGALLMVFALAIVLVPAWLRER